MTPSLISPKSAIQLVLSRKTKALEFGLYHTASQKWAFMFAVIFLFLGAGIGVAAYFWEYPKAIFFAMASILLASVLGVVYQLAFLVPELAKLKNPELSIASPVVDNFNEDIDLIAELARDFQPQHLRFAEERFSTMASQLRSRIGLLVGAVEKVGIIPIAVTAYISATRILKDKLVLFTGIEWILVAFICLYLFALRMHSVAQWMDGIALLYREALKCSTKEPNTPRRE